MNGFSCNRSSLVYNLDDDFTLKNGSPVSIKIIPEEIQSPPQGKPNPSRLMVRATHNDWHNDWTPYDTISVWIYFSDLESMEENVVRIGVYGNITETYYGPVNSLNFKKQDLVVGWNNLQVSLDELLVFKSSWDSEEHSISVGDIIDRRGELGKFRSHLFIDVTSPKPFYVSDIQLLTK